MKEHVSELTIKIKYEFHDRLYNLSILPITVISVGMAKVTLVHPTESKNIMSRG